MLPAFFRTTSAPTYLLNTLIVRSDILPRALDLSFKPKDGFRQGWETIFSNEAARSQRQGLGGNSPGGILRG